MAKDRYKYFRVEARELVEGLNQGLLELEKDGGNKEVVARILRLAHTLKGAARVVKQPGIADVAHAVEGSLAASREEPNLVPKETIDEALALIDTISKQVATLDLQEQDAKAETGPAQGPEPIETVRVEIEEVDRLLDGVSEAGVQITALRREAANLLHMRQLAAALTADLMLTAVAQVQGGLTGNAKARAAVDDLRVHAERIERNLRSGLDHLQAEFSQVRDAANRLRLLPASVVFAGLERAVRDAAQSLEKEVVFEGIGGDNRLDTHVLAGVRDALLHAVRNSVAHGIESPQERIKAGKPPRGRIELRVEKRGSQTAFVCRDDGKGIDVEAIRQAAIKRGLAVALQGTSFGMEDAVRIILDSRISTSESVNEFAGRGIGMDVVRETAARLKGKVIVASERGKGTTVEICVPVSLSSLTAVEVDAGGTIASLPQEAVREILRIPESEVARSGERQSVVYGGQAIPFFPLARALSRNGSAARSRSAWSAVVIEGSSGMAAVGVDRVLGTSRVVARPLPTLVKTDSFIAGASLDAEGNPRLLLDPESLATKISAENLSCATASPPQRLPVLVVDDSLTTRMLEQNILESAGYVVDLATSGEEGLRKAAEKPYSLFLVDVEMPGIDGFEFVARTQADAGLRSIPSILVTSRSAAEDRQQGEKVGARGYVVKGEFDQLRLLQMIEELVRSENGQDARFGG
jgi:two-component system, chemotaxis family, sensor kinase CheA